MVSPLIDRTLSLRCVSLNSIFDPFPLLPPSIIDAFAPPQSRQKGKNRLHNLYLVVAISWNSHFRDNAEASFILNAQTRKLCQVPLHARRTTLHIDCNMLLLLLRRAEWMGGQNWKEKFPSSEGLEQRESSASHLWICRLNECRRLPLVPFFGRKTKNCFLGSRLYSYCTTTTTSYERAEPNCGHFGFCSGASASMAKAKGGNFRSVGNRPHRHRGRRMAKCSLC